MNIGDPKKAIVLGAVAIIILCVAAFQIIPRDHKIAASVSRSQGAAVAAVEVKTNAALPNTLTSTPFAKTKSPIQAPNLAPKPKGLKPVDPSSGMGGAGQSGASGSPPPIPGTFVVAPANVPMGAGTLPATGPGTSPSENTGKDRQQVKEKSKTLTLEAVMRVDKRIAVLTIDGNEDVPFKCQVGSIIEGYRVIEMSDSGIVLQIGKKKVPLTVGSTVTL